MGLYKGKNSKS